MKVKKIIWALVALATSGIWADVVPYSKAEFLKAQEDGKSVVIDVAAWWCPVCRIQKSRITSLIEDEVEFKNTTVFVVSNGDSETKQEFGVSSRGTVIAFKGKTEKSRLVLETDKEKLRELLRSGL